MFPPFFLCLDGTLVERNEKIGADVSQVVQRDCKLKQKEYFVKGKLITFLKIALVTGMMTLNRSMAD